MTDGTPVHRSRRRRIPGRVVWVLGVLASVVARVAVGSRGVPWRIVLEETALGLVVYVAGLVAIVAPIVVLWVVPACLWTCWRTRSLPRALAVYLLAITAGAWGFSGAFFALMVRYGSAERPTVRYLRAHPPASSPARR